MTRITRLVVITQKNQELNKYKDRINLSYTNKPSRYNKSLLYNKGDKQAKSKANNRLRQLKIFIVFIKQNFEFCF